MGAVADEPRQFAPLAFIDCETTGLNPESHEIWEVGLITDDTEYLWHLPVNLQRADPVALDIGGFHERYGKEEALRTIRQPANDRRAIGGGSERNPIYPLDKFASEFMTLTWGRHLVGCVTSFDERRLGSLLKKNGAVGGWHYHLVCVENLVAGRYGMQPPWKSDEMFAACGIDRDAPEFAKHTAMGDARLAKAAYEHVMAEGTDPALLVAV